MILITGEGQWLSWLGSKLAVELGATYASLLLYIYIEVDEDSSSGSVFIDEGNRIMYHGIDRELWAQLFDDWHSLPDDRRWAVMQYKLHADNRFEVSYRFAEEVDVSDMDPGGKRETAAARAAFGGKPIHYPPLSENAFDISDDRSGFDLPLG